MAIKKMSKCLHCGKEFPYEITSNGQVRKFDDKKCRTYYHLLKFANGKKEGK